MTDKFVNLLSVIHNEPKTAHMKSLRLFFVLLVLLSAATVSAQVSKLNPITNPTLAELRENFKNPHRDFSTGPLWTWNDRLTEDQVRGTLRDLAGQHVKQVWVHPRPGLMTPYLSDEWFACWKAALDEAQKLDMNVWIYDENSYPSGFAGGFVPEALPDSRARSLGFEYVDQPGKIGDDVLFVFNADGKLLYDKSRQAAAPTFPAVEGKQYTVVKNRWGGAGGWYGGKWYVDILKKGVTEKFLDVTLDAYKNVPEIQKEFGKRVPGIFTDEPHPAGALVWNDEIPEDFEKKFGYSLIENLPSLVKPVGDWKKIRHNYYQIVLDKFIENWSIPYFERCEKYGLELTGHYWEHGWPNTSHGPDNMAMYAWHQRPAIDLLMNTYNNESPNAQFGNVRSVKELASVANQMGHSRTLSENYGAGGWDLRFEDMKRLGDWSYALGVNTNNEHLSYVTIRGARKRDHPQSFSYHATWFEGYHALADYFTRLSYVLSQGRQVNRIVVIEPTTTAWMYQGTPELGKIGQSFTDFVNLLERNQVEYDLASEDIIKRFGKVETKDFVINQAKYDLVIIPPNTENLNAATWELLSKYKQNGGHLIHVGKIPVLRDGSPFPMPMIFQKEITVAEAVAAAKARTAEDGLVISTNPPEAANVFHHRRRLADGEVVFICNSNQDKEVDLVIKKKGYVAFCGLSEKIISSSIKSVGNIQVKMLPSTSCLLIFSDEEIKDDPKAWSRRPVVTPINGSETKIRRLEDNVLTLDYVDVKVGDEERNDIYTWQANRWIFQKHGLGGNPWDSQVQFKDELITKTFPENSGFEAVYHFTLRESVPQNLSVVIERPDLYKVFCNNIEVKPEPGVWWLDKSFGKIDLSKVAKIGENSVKIVAKPMTIEHELEPAYLLGDFSLQNIAKGFAVVPPKPLKLQTEIAIEEWHNEELERVAWLSAGVNFRPNNPAFSNQFDRSPSLEFDLGKEQQIAAIRIWNYNERNLKQRGVKTVEITSLGKIELPIGNGFSHELLFDSPQMFRTISFKILSNHNGVTYPFAENAKPNDNGFVGLAEVQFLVREGDQLVPIKNVTVKASSELVIDSHDRKAQYLIDGSGIGVGSMAQGWNQQGMPFYAGKVEYSRTFHLEKVDAQQKYFVKLPPSPTGWYGATAQITVNGQSAGFVVSAPWQIEVAKNLKGGENEIAVIVYGTPKNLLGPHHAGVLRGSAWPGNFHRAPEHQPNGAAYDTIGYGLFEPFTLVSLVSE
ncbi:MAG: hypothetical protein LBQ50_01335 [Planctomycetaceae bacterium]|nr:hypothetical protein [Planctomycetaceae bacterium]